MTTRPIARLSLTICADSLAVRAIGPWLERLLSAVSAGEAQTLLARLELAVHEVCINSVDHAELPPNAQLDLTGQVESDRVVVEVSDHGQPFDDQSVAEPVDGVPQIRGYGLMIIRRSVDELSYRRSGTMNVWRLDLKRSLPEGSAIHA